MRNYAVLIAGAAAALAVFDGQVSVAQTVSYDVTVDVVSGPLSGERYTGTTLIDLTDPSNNNEIFKSTSIVFNFGGTEFTELDDVQDPDANSPRANFQDSNFLGNTFIVSRFGNHPTDIPLIQDIAIDGFAIDNNDFGYLIGTDLYRGTVSYSLLQNSEPLDEPFDEPLDEQIQTVPEPSVWVGLATVCWTAGCGRQLTRRRVS
ncbi:MAG: hypothetical protein AAF579_14250 [Cyanobacteria bacterium P01_C01_bin.118]